MKCLIAAAVVTLVSASFANAQIIYEPVQYQYGEGNHRYYYGGSDPAVFARAEYQRRLDELSDIPAHAQRYTHAYLHHRLIGQLDRVYSDAVPYTNARVYGYLPVDAANDAYANAPRNFRKRDLLRAAVVLPDGSRVVPAQAQPVRVQIGDDEDRATTRRSPRPRAIIIIPKKAKTSDKLVASAAK